jgi:hypothetical protein
MADWKLEDGRARFVRHGHGPERSIQTGIGAVPVQRAKIRDRGAGEVEERIRFSSAILPRWARRWPSLEALLPVLYLSGVSTGDFQEALSALLGPDAPHLSPSVPTMSDPAGSRTNGTSNTPPGRNGISRDGASPPAVHGAQDRERAQQGAEIGPEPGQA